MKNFLRPTILRPTAAFLLGALLTLAFAPFNLFPLAILSMTGLLALWLQTSPKRAFTEGFLFGVGLFGTGMHWVFVSMHTFGGLNVIVAAFFTLLLIAYLSLFPAITGYWLNRYFPKENLSKIFCAFPILWLFTEWVRGWLFTGLPWLMLGYTQIHSPLKGYAPIFSVYGISFLVLLSASLIYAGFRAFQLKNTKNLYRYIFIFLFIWAFGSALSFIYWTKPFGAPIKVSLVQGNIPQSLKWNADQVAPTLARYMQLSSSHWNSQLIVWPESAIPITLQVAHSFVDDLDNQAKQHKTSIITGVPVEASTPNAYYNAVIMIGNGSGIYAKQRLVPFGEYVPFNAIFGKLFDLLNVPMSEFIPGPNIPNPLQTGNLKIASFICYEIAYPQRVLQRDRDINLLLTVSNDAWFGHSVALAQHLEMGQMRALEMGRPLLFVSNTGLTAIVNPEGNIQSEAPPYQAYVLEDTIQPMQGRTPLQVLNINPIILIAVALYIVALRERPNSKPKNTNPWYGKLYSRFRIKRK